MKCMTPRAVVTVFVCLLLYASASAVPQAYFERHQPSSEPKEVSPPTAALSELESFSENQAVSGDTVLLFCDDLQLTLATFGGTDCWGWRAPDGTDYAIMGTGNGVSFVDVTTGQVADEVPGPQTGCSNSYWRDMVTYQHYCYVVSECVGTNEGMMVIDMQYLPDSVHLIKTFNIFPGGIPYSHNLTIDTVQGIAYAEAYSSEDFSIVVWDLTDPEDPQFIHNFGIGGGGIHDLYAADDLLYVAEGSNGSFAIYDMTNKTAPQLLTRVQIPVAGYVHNIWPSSDGNYAVTTEETPNKTVKIWDIQNLSDIQLVGEYLGPSNLAHNAQWEDDTVYISHYESGVSMVDVSNPASPSELAVFDTYSPSDDAEFEGCWGVYPHTPDGRIYASNKDGRLFVLSRQEVILADTLYGEQVVGIPGTQVRVDVNAVNSLPIHKFIIPFSWSGPLNIVFDSASTAGLRTDYFESRGLVSFDPFNSRAAYSMTASSGTSNPDLAPGDGPILSLYFTIPEGASGDPNPISFTPFSSFPVSFIHSCLPFRPDTVSATVTTGGNCCVDTRGNINNDNEDAINISDLSYLVAFMFKDGPVPPCPDEANVNGAAGIDVADLTYLVQFMFNSGPDPSACP